jgi:hypothetical protein
MHPVIVGAIVGRITGITVVDVLTLRKWRG